MTPLLFTALALAGGLGAVARFTVDSIIKSRTQGVAPWGTIVINLTGSLLLGFITGLAMAQVLPEGVRQVAGAGFLGGYTTFSTASFETVRLLQERRWMAGLFTGLGVLVAATVFAGLGFWIGAHSWPR